MASSRARRKPTHGGRDEGVFIRRKIVRGITYYALVESYRSEGKVRQRTLLSLGRNPTLEAAITKEIGYIEFARSCSTAWQEHAIPEYQKRIRVLEHWRSVVAQKPQRLPIRVTTGPGPRAHTSRRKV
jgi:hypothetical protein